MSRWLEMLNSCWNRHFFFIKIITWYLWKVSFKKWKEKINNHMAGQCRQDNLYFYRRSVLAFGYCLSLCLQSGKLTLPTRQCECILSWASRKLAWVSVSLYRTCILGHLFLDECSKILVSHTGLSVQWKVDMDVISYVWVSIKSLSMFKLGSPNLDQKCKWPWLRSLLFCGMIDLNPQVQI